MPSWFVNGCYGLTFMYVAVAIGHHTQEAYSAGCSQAMVARSQRRRRAGMLTVLTSNWHSQETRGRAMRSRLRPSVPFSWYTIT